jgi:oxygen-independent coproporphyrinogen III oxidase
MHGPSSPSIGLYVHVPFCVSKCAYCDFASYPGRAADVSRYVETVICEIARRGEETGHPAADTIFLGGGTPSLLNASQVSGILAALRGAFPIEPDAEITCECNPGTLTPAFAQALACAGVNRLSLGAQAMQPGLLQLLGRIHTWEQVIASVEIARQAGFANINLDLMFGLPTQAVAELRDTLAAALALAPTHVSCYGLIVEEETPLARDIAAGTLTLPDEDAERGMYELARQILAAHGLEQYEISNFARPGFVCRHNIGCWTRVPYLGFGCAAHSFFDECRTMNPSALDAYLAGQQPQAERISKEEARFESMMLGLRMTCGVDDADFSRMHGMTIAAAFGDKLAKPLAAGLLQWQDGTLRLTRRGMDLQNSVLVELL